MLSNRFFPYSSMQEINLDWILTKVKNILRFVPDDGAVGQILRRTAHGAEWSDEQGAGGSVTSVNGMQGAVVLTAADVGALPDTYAAPVDSVNGQTGAVVLSIPSDTSDLTNGAGYVDAAGAAAAAPVQSVNGQTGAVVLSIPSDTSDLTNTAGFVNASGAAAAAPVQSVNGQTGTVVLDAADVGAAEPNDSGTGYCKMPDGTLICWVSASLADYNASSGGPGVFFGPEIDLPNWPVSFISLPIVAYMATASGGVVFPYSGQGGFSTTSAGKVRAARHSSAAVGTVTAGAIAVGRWKN